MSSLGLWSSVMGIAVLVGLFVFAWVECRRDDKEGDEA